MPVAECVAGCRVTATRISPPSQALVLESTRLHAAWNERPRTGGESDGVAVMRIWAEARFTRFLIIILAAAAAGAAFKGLRSGWLRPDPPRPVPTYVAGWEELLQIGSRSGPSDAQVDIVEFVDFQCPYCRDAHETLNKVLSKYPDQVALTLVHFPLDYHPYAASAANAYECAREQDDHRAFADRMFTSQDSIGVSPWLWFASPQVDSAQFMACLDRAPADEMVQEALVAARKYSVSATPTILIGGWRYAWLGDGGLAADTAPSGLTTHGRTNG